MRNVDPRLVVGAVALELDSRDTLVTIVGRSAELNGRKDKLVSDRIIEILERDARR